jgi:hypothetical protein
MGFLRRVISINHGGRRENAEGAEKNTEGAEKTQRALRKTQRAQRKNTVLYDHNTNNNSLPLTNFASCRSMNYQELQWI